MGIRCYCPNGHKLNIKAFQAGLRGVCPRCGESFVIPRHSTRRSTKGRSGEASGSSELAEGGDHQAGSTGSAIAAPEQEMEISIHTVEGGENPSALRYTPPPQPPKPPEPPRPAVELVDPIEEDPVAIWYVRPPTGGQFGPADGEVMRQWIAEGRISVNSLVWREGWEQWEEAIQVFPQLSPQVNAAANPAVSNPAMSTLPTVGVVKPSRRKSSVEPVAAPPSTKGGKWIWVIGVVVGLAVIGAGGWAVYALF